jgi:hypothetical protein
MPKQNDAEHCNDRKDTVQKRTEIVSVERYAVGSKTLLHLALGDLMILGEQAADFGPIVLLVFLGYAWHVMRVLDGFLMYYNLHVKVKRE